jgi:hypothetical protein
LAYGKLRHADFPKLVHQAAEYRALTAAGGDGAAAQSFEEAVFGQPSGHGDRFDLPIDLCRADVGDIFDEAPVVQITESEKFGTGSDGHRGDDLVLVDVDGQSAFADPLQLAALLVLV